MIKQKIKQDKDSERGIYPVLKAPNFYFPIADTGKKFRVENTYNLPIKDKKIIQKFKDYKEMSQKMNGFSFGYIQPFAEIFWHAIKEYKLDKQYSNCWLVPIRISTFGEELEVDIDVLRPVSSNKKK